MYKWAVGVYTARPCANITRDSTCLRKTKFSVAIIETDIIILSLNMSLEPFQ